MCDYTISFDGTRLCFVSDCGAFCLYRGQTDEQMEQAALAGVFPAVDAIDALRICMEHMQDAANIRAWNDECDEDCGLVA